jgi:hypothetical protein
MYFIDKAQVSLSPKREGCQYKKKKGCTKVVNFSCTNYIILINYSN